MRRALGSVIGSGEQRPRWAAVVGVGLAVLATGCGGPARTERRGAPPVPVRVGTVERRTVPVTFNAIGTVEPVETVEVKSRIGGELVAVRFREGQAVAAGEVLAEIDPRPYAAALEQAKAILARDEALLAKAEADVTRYAELVAKDFVSREQYDQVVAGAASLRATVAADRAAVDNASLNLEFCTITAPVSGRTGTLRAKLGNLVKANETVLVTINRTRPIDVAFAVPAKLLPQVLARRSASIAVAAVIPDDPGPAEQGTLAFVDNAVDQATNTVLLKAAFPNAEERLWPGQFVDVTVVLGEEPDRVVCPAAAVQTGQAGQYVFVVTASGTAEQRPVVVARADEREAVIESGLSAGETVVTDGQLRLAPGAPVEIAPSSGRGTQP